MAVHVESVNLNDSVYDSQRLGETSATELILNLSPSRLHSSVDCGAEYYGFCFGTQQHRCRAGQGEDLKLLLVNHFVSIQRETIDYVRSRTNKAYELFLGTAFCRRFLS